MQYCLIAQAAEAGMSVHYLDSLAYYDVAEDGEEGEDGWEGRFAVHDEEWYVVDLEAIRQVSHTCSASVRVSDDNHLVAAIDEFLRASV
jgi:hypothetical protein